MKRPDQNRQQSRPAIYLFAAVFLLRLIAISRLTSSPFLLPAHGDMHFYNDWGQRIAHGEWTDHLAFYGLPLYAYLLAGIYKVFGYSPFVPAFLQACLEGGTAVLIYRIAVKVFAESAETAPAKFSGTLAHYRGEIIGIVAAAGWGFFQPAEAYSIILMPTSWLVFVFWFLAWQVIARDDLPAFGTMLLFGILIGVAATGVATIFFIIPLLLGGVFFKWQATGRKARVVASIILLLGTILGASPAFLHNYFVASDPVLISAHGGINFWIGNNPWANGYPRFPPGLHAGQEAMLQDSIRGAESAAGHSLKRSEVSAYWMGQARQYIAHNFGAWLKLLGRKILNFWNAFQYDDLSVITTLREERVILPGISFGLLAALSIPGIILAWRRFRAARWIAFAVILHMVSLLGVFVTERYRLAAVPGLLLFAGFGIWEFWENCVTAHFRLAIAYAAMLLLATAFVSIPTRDPSLWALDIYNTGLQALDLNHFQVAEKKLDLAYAYVPENAELNFALGNLRLAQGQRQLAKSYYLTTLRLDPRHEGSYNNLGILALEEGRGPLAAKFFTKALEQDSKDAKTYYLLARAYLTAGDSSRARKEIDQAIKLDPSRPEFKDFQEKLKKDAQLP